MSQKIKYTCKNCGWETSIREDWMDLKPKRCMNKKCNTSFIKFPESLEVAMPAKQEHKQESKSHKQKRQRDED